MKAGQSTRMRWLAAGALMLVAEWTFYENSIVPAMTQEREIRHENASLQNQISDAQTTISEVGALEAKIARERTDLDSLNGNVPAGSAMVWMPELVEKHFLSYGTAVSVVRLGTILDPPDLPDYRRGYWSIALPIDADGQNINSLLLAVTTLHQQNPFLRVLDFAIRPDPENPDGRVALMNLTTLIPK